MSTEAPQPGAGDESAEPSLSDEQERSAFDAVLRQVARAPREDPVALRPLAPGSVLAGRFEVVREIGRGGFARVLEARDLVLSRPVAIKLLRRRRRLSDSQLELFRREATATARLNHPHIVTAHDWGVWDETPFLVLELLEGETLRAQVARGPLPEDRAWQIAAEITDALIYAHSMGVLHLDLKSQNAFVLRDGRIKVLDFGLAGLGEMDESASRLPRMAGTPATMAPEQVVGASVDARTDLWAVGVILHEMLFGRLPEPLTPGMERVTFPAETSRRAEQILSRTLCRDPGARYPDAAALAVALGEGRGSAPADAGALVASTGPRKERGVADLIRRRLTVIGLAAGALVLAALLASRVGLGARHDERWLLAEVIPEIHRLVDSNQLMAAQRLAMRADAELPGNPALTEAWSRFTRRTTIKTDPPGAKVFWREYDAAETAWEYLGRTPLSLRYPFGVHRLRFELDGYRPYEAAPNVGFADPFPLDRLGALADDLVHVPRGRFGPGSLLEPSELGGYLLDRYEVTNSRYRAFVEAGGYNRPEFWRQTFVRDGRRLSWEEAMTHFTDRTGHPGPRTWEQGSYPAGEDDHPVGGVSWYEAMAYAVFEGRELPTFFHWRRAAWGPAAGYAVTAASNFAGLGPARVGGYPGISELGASDMAGNVREWCINEGMGRPADRFIVGGGWNDPAYTFTSPGLLSPWDRSVTNGFRLVTYSEESPNLNRAKEPVEWGAASGRDYSKEKPVGDLEFGIYQRLYVYDPRPLNPKLLKTEPADEWIREKVSFDAAYGNERVVAYLFLPRNGTPPYQTIIYFPGMGALPGGASFDNWGLPYWDFIIHSGRALIYPIYRGTFERPTELRTVLPDSSVAYRDAVIRWNQDLRRTIDYLETREDIDRTRLGYFGLSWGGMLGGLMSALEPRLKAAVFQVAGLDFARPLPEADPLNFLPRVKIPVLMLNGQYDEYFPLETSQRPMFELLGTPPGQKRLVVYEAGSKAPFPRDQVMKDVLDWYDRYLGPVARNEK